MHAIALFNSSITSSINYLIFVQLIIVSIRPPINSQHGKEPVAGAFPTVASAEAGGRGGGRAAGGEAAAGVAASTEGTAKGGRGGGGGGKRAVAVEVAPAAAATSTAGTGTEPAAGTETTAAAAGTGTTAAAGTAAATATAATAAVSTAPRRASSVREAFRSKVLSGLLLHLCPPSGQFADMFGVSEELRRTVLGMLGARDLATFGLVRDREGRRGERE